MLYSNNIKFYSSTNSSYYYAIYIASIFTNTFTIPISNIVAIIYFLSKELATITKLELNNLSIIGPSIIEDLLFIIEESTKSLFRKREGNLLFNID